MNHNHQLQTVTVFSKVQMYLASQSYEEIILNL
jgi:hypothetical protein